MDGVELEQVEDVVVATKKMEEDEQPVDDDNDGNHNSNNSSPEGTQENDNIDSNNNNNNSNKSALQDNIERKGQNAYYFAHAHKATGPAWDGKLEPRLLSRNESKSDENVGGSSSIGSRSISTGGGSTVAGHRKPHSFDYAKSNITTYAFLDDDKAVKLYIDLEKVGETCSEDDICLDFTESSFSLVIKNYVNSSNPAAAAISNNNNNNNNGVLCLSFGKLTADITNASYKKKKDRIILTLTKAAKGQWHTVNDKGSADHELV